jgi:hypothetical protein
MKANAEGRMQKSGARSFWIVGLSALASPCLLATETVFVPVFISFSSLSLSLYLTRVKSGKIKNGIESVTVNAFGPGKPAIENREDYI